MTYLTGNLIQATDYNTLVSNGTNIGDQWGVGSGSHGLGQSTSAITPVAPANQVTAVQWTGLIQTINNCLLHQGATSIAPGSVTAGSPITAFGTLTTGSALAYANSGTSGIALVASSPNNAAFSGTWGNTGGRTLVFTHTVTFASANAARYFFNAGGNVALSFSRTGGSSTLRNSNWSTTASECGTVVLGYMNTTKVGGGGLTPSIIRNTNNGGYWAGTPTDLVHFKQFDAPPSYTTDYIQVEYHWSGTMVAGGSPVMNIKTTWANAYVNPLQDSVDGISTTALVVNSPATTYLTNTWGTPAVNGIVSIV